MGDAEFTELPSENWEEAQPRGLVAHTGGLAILKIAEEWVSGEFTCANGYFLMKPSGPLELKKTEERVFALPSLSKTASDFEVGIKTAGTTLTLEATRAGLADAIGVLAAVGAKARNPRRE